MLGVGVSLKSLRGNVASGVAWTPAELGADLALWLDADDASTITLNGSTVSQWDDKSGNARNATQASAANQPTYTASAFNNKPGITFDGSDDNLAVNYNYSGNQATVYAVVSRLPGGSSEQWVFSSYGGSNGTPLVAPMWAKGPLAGAEWATYSNTFRSCGVRLTQDGTPYALGLVSDISGSVLDAYTNGSKTAQFATAVRFTGGGARNYIGAEVDGNSRFLSGRVSEIIQCEAVLPDTDRQKLEGYLAWKWGLEENLPIDHPYRFDGSLFGYGLAPNAANYGAGATTAYSLRYVSNSYSGPVVRVREDSGNTEQDFTPVQITDGTLEAFVGVGNNGFVTTWYDQSGNGKNATQTTAVSQPKIVNAGALITENGKPAIVFDGVNDSLITNGYIVELSQNNVTLFATGRFAGPYDLTEADGSTPYSSNFILSGPAGGTEIVWVNTSSFGTKDAVNQSLMGFIYDGVNFQAYLNGAASGAAGPATVNPEVGNTTVIGSRADFVTSFSTSTLQEIIIYRSDESANRSAIELNINQHYGVY